MKLIPHIIIALLAMTGTSLVAQEAPGRQGAVIPLVLNAENLNLENQPSDEGPWLTLEYRATPDNGLLHSEVAEKIWWLQDRPLLLLGSTGNPLPLEVLNRATAWLQIFHLGEPLGKPIPLQPRADQIKTSANPEAVGEALRKRLGSPNAALLSQVANFLAKNTSVLDMEASSYSLSSQGTVIDSSGTWLGDTPWPWQGTTNDSYAYSEESLSIGTTQKPFFGDLLLEDKALFMTQDPDLQLFIGNQEVDQRNFVAIGHTIQNSPGAFNSDYNFFFEPEEEALGIGSLPDAKLHVFGNDDTSLANPGILILGSTSGANMTFDANEIIARNNGNASTLFLQDGGGPIEYRAAVHTYKVGSTHNLIMQEKTGNSPILRPSTGGFGWLGDTDHAFWNVMTNNIHRDNEFTLSDRRIKKNIETLSQPLTLLGQLRGVHYDIDAEKHPFYKNGSEAPNLSPHRMGFIAQEFAQVFPDMVSTDEVTGLMAIRNQEELLPVLVEAIKDQQAMIEKLQRRLVALENQ